MSVRKVAADKPIYVYFIIIIFVTTQNKNESGKNKQLKIPTRKIDINMQ